MCFGFGFCGNRLQLEHGNFHGFGMDALVSKCSWSTNVITLWACALEISIMHAGQAIAMETCFNIGGGGRSDIVGGD